MVSKDDWRRMGQEEYLMEKELRYVGSYTSYSATREHEHCCFCAANISAYDGDLHEGFCTTDDKQSYWICKDSFEDFNNEFRWIICIN